MFGVTRNSQRLRLLTPRAALLVATLRYDPGHPAVSSVTVTLQLLQPRLTLPHPAQLQAMRLSGAKLRHVRPDNPDRVTPIPPVAMATCRR